MRIPAGYGINTNAVSSYILTVTHTGRLNGIQKVVPINVHRDRLHKKQLAEIKGIRNWI